ncbi:MAG: DUF1559 domain-containing protein [Pirellulaceae bacterium]
MSRNARPAFTLIELLVCIAIMGVLAAMILPAVQAARETANLTSCKNNLFQQILAVHNYEMTHEHYPPGTIEKQGPIANTAIGYHHNWVIELLPYIDQQNTYRHIDREVGVYHVNNEDIRGMTQPWLQCPSGNPLRGYSWYAAVHHDVEAPIDVDNNGVFFLNSRVRHEQITDGASHTLFLGEKQPGPYDLGWMSGTKATLRNTGGGIAPPNYTLLPDGYPVTEVAPDPKVGGFTSWHRNAVQFATGDGAVHTVNIYITPAVLEQLGHRADGKLLDPSWDR